ncbi:type VI secretion system baseplate subunit TssK [Pseudomonas sp. PCH446]
MQVSRLNLKLAREVDVAASHVFLRVARVLERTAAGLVVLDRQQVAPLLAWRCSPVLARSVDELIARARQRGAALAEGLGQGGLGGMTEIQQYVMLQSVNRAESLLLHLASQPALHPELLYRELVRLAGELAIFYQERKRPRAYPPYRHDRLGESFVPLIQDLLQALSAVASAEVVALALKSGAFGFRFAQVPDINLYQSARFILAVRAQLPDEELRKSFPNRLKIGPAERLHDLVNLQLPGWRSRCYRRPPGSCLTIPVSAISNCRATTLCGLTWWIPAVSACMWPVRSRAAIGVLGHQGGVMASAKAPRGSRQRQREPVQAGPAAADENLRG